MKCSCRITSQCHSGTVASISGQTDGLAAERRFELKGMPLLSSSHLRIGSVTLMVDM